MTSRLSRGAFGALRRFAALGGERLGRSPDAPRDQLLERTRGLTQPNGNLLAIFANVLELDESGEPTNEQYAERRAARWLYQYCTGELPPGEPALQSREVELY
jgi:hypothetical protein